MAMPAALTRPLDAAADLAKFALDSGGLDNITVVIIPFPPRTGRRTRVSRRVTGPRAGQGEAERSRRPPAARVRPPPPGRGCSRCLSRTEAADSPPPRPAPGSSGGPGT